MHLQADDPGALVVFSCRVVTPRTSDPCHLRTLVASGRRPAPLCPHEAPPHRPVIGVKVLEVTGQQALQNRSCRAGNALCHHFPLYPFAVLWQGRDAVQVPFEPCVLKASANRSLLDQLCGSRRPRARLDGTSPSARIRAHSSASWDRSWLQDPHNSTPFARPARPLLTVNLAMVASCASLRTLECILPGIRVGQHQS